MTNFEIAFKYLLDRDEGRKYTNDPDDAGGPTKFGITKKVYQDFFGKLVLDSEIENMTEDVASQIYLALYWHRLSCGKMQNLAIAVCIFDSGVLYGVGTVALLTQEVLSSFGAALKFDGIIGDKCVGFLNLAERGPFIKAFVGLLLRRIDKIIAENPRDEKYRHGWTARANRLLALTEESFLTQLKGES